MSSNFLLESASTVLLESGSALELEDGPSIIQATLAAPLGALTATATATPQPEATLAAPLGSLVASATATPQPEATLAAPLGSLSSTASATVTHEAVLAAPLGSLTAAATEDVTHNVEMAAPLGALTAALSATVAHQEEATLAAPLGSLRAALLAQGSVSFAKVVYVRRPTDADPNVAARNPLGNRLMRHASAQPVGVNVYILNDGTVTEASPNDWSTVRRVLWGSHSERVDPDEQALLVAAGYGGYLDG